MLNVANTKPDPTLNPLWSLFGIALVYLYNRVNYLNFVNNRFCIITSFLHVHLQSELFLLPAVCLIRFFQQEPSCRSQPVHRCYSQLSYENR